MCANSKNQQIINVRGKWIYFLRLHSDVYRFLFIDDMQATIMTSKNNYQNYRRVFADNETGCLVVRNVYGFCCKNNVTSEIFALVLPFVFLRFTNYFFAKLIQYYARATSTNIKK
jgi:hypothetical protein